MKNPIYVATVLLGVSVYCAGSENAGKPTASDFDVLQSRMTAYEKHCNIPSFFSWDYWSPPAVKAYRCTDYYKDIQKLEDTLKNTDALPLTADKLISEAYYLGKAREMFKRDCTTLNPYSWFTNQNDVINCKALIQFMHRQYRTLSPKSVLKDDQLLEITEPFKVGSFDFEASNNAQKIYEQQYGLPKNTTFEMFLDKDGELKRYYFGELKRYYLLSSPGNNKGNDPIDYTRPQIKQ